MYQDFDDFEDEHQYHRLKHEDSISLEVYEWDHVERIEPEYVMDSFSEEFAKELFLALGGITKNFSGFDQNDDPQDLYHPNNKTILDASTMPDTPVEPEDFLAKVTAELRSNKVVISDAMPDLLVGMCKLFNFSIQPNQKLPRTIRNLVFPAQTGIGKSVSVQVYVSMLSSHSSVIVVSKVEEAINYCNYINHLSGDDDYARCYYAITDKNKDDPMRVEPALLQNHRCIVITHNMFRRVNGFDNTEIFSHYQNSPRDFVSIDEKLSFFDQYQFGYKELDKLINNVEKAISESEQLNVSSTSHDALGVLKAFKNFLLNKDDKILTDSKSIVIRDLLTEDLKSALQSIGENLQYSDYSSGMLKKLINLKDKQAALKVVQDLRIATQARKRKVIGVPFMDISRELDRFSDLDDFYCELLDDWFLANCKKKPEYSEDHENKVDLFHDDYDHEYASRYHDEMMKQAEEDHKAGIVSSSGLSLALKVIRALLRFRTDELLKSLEDLGANKNPNYRNNILNKIDEQITTLEYFALNHFLIYKTNYETALIATENLTNQLGLSVVLDATATINEYYQLANRFLGHVGLVEASQIRQYQNLTIHKAVGFNQSRYSLYKSKEPDQIKAVALSYSSYVLNELVDGDKMLIICHKDFKSTLKKYLNDNRVEFTHWGNHVGRNSWSHCNKVVLIGWPTLNPIEYVSTINSSLESVLLTSRYLDDSLIEKFEISQLADDIVQGLMRSQARIIATQESDCKETSFYLFYSDDEKSKKVLELVESQFSKAKIVNWVPRGDAVPKKKGPPQLKVDLIIDLLIEKAKNHETYLRSDVEEETGINKSTMTRILKSDYMKKKLEEQGFIFKNKDLRSQQFILK